MERISAVICELNPLHDGHRYLFDTVKKDSDLLIAVMSGNFVQRGECAVFDKYSRAKSAINAGADLCVELPFPFSASSAEFFAAAGVDIAEKIGATDLWFGSECGDPKALKTAADILDKNLVSSTSRAAVKREEILKNSGIILPQSIYSSPNDILGCEYCRKASINLHPILRIETETSSQIRSKMQSISKLTEIEFYHFRTKNDDQTYADGFGGVKERLLNTSLMTNNSDEWFGLAATKQYTNSRFRRTALFDVVGVKQEYLKVSPEFSTVLAANSKGREYLSKIRKTSEITLISNSSDRYSLDGKALLQYEISSKADKLYTLAMGIDDVGYFAKCSPAIL